MIVASFQFLKIRRVSKRSKKVKRKVKERKFQIPVIINNYRSKNLVK